MMIADMEMLPDSKVYGANMGANRTQVGPMLAPWTMLSGLYWPFVSRIH